MFRVRARFSGVTDRRLWLVFWLIISRMWRSWAVDFASWLLRRPAMRSWRSRLWSWRLMSWFWRSCRCIRTRGSRVCMTRFGRFWRRMTIVSWLRRWVGLLDDVLDYVWFTVWSFPIYVLSRELSLVVCLIFLKSTLAYYICPETRIQLQVVSRLPLQTQLAKWNLLKLSFHTLIQTCT